MNQPHLVIRPAQAADKAAVLAFTATIWDGDDYITEVWDDWLGASDGPLLVGALDGQPVALAKISDLGQGEGWIHGVRVDPALQGRGYGRQMLIRCLALARERGDPIVRLMTSADNTTMQRAVEGLGFKLALESAWFAGSPLAEPWALAPLAADQLGRMLGQIAAGGLYCVGWRFRALDAGRLREHLTAGEVLGLPGAAAWAIVAAEDTIWVGGGYGPEAELVELLRLARAHPGSNGDDLRALIPQNDPLAPLLVRAGYRAEDHAERCYELHLLPRSPGAPIG